MLNCQECVTGMLQFFTSDCFFFFKLDTKTPRFYTYQALYTENVLFSFYWHFMSIIFSLTPSFSVVVFFLPFNSKNSQRGGFEKLCWAVHVQYQPLCLIDWNFGQVPYLQCWATNIFSGWGRKASFLRAYAMFPQPNGALSSKRQLQFIDAVWEITFKLVLLSHFSWYSTIYYEARDLLRLNVLPPRK